MKAFLPHEMMEATRLTRVGRLSEATAVIQALFGGEAQAAPTPTGSTATALPAPQLELTAIDADVSTKAGPGVFASFKSGRKTPHPPKGLVLPHLPGRKAPSRSEIAPAEGQYLPATISGAAGPHTYKL